MSDRESPSQQPPIRTLSSREVYRNHWLRLREDEVERSNGTRGIYGVIDKDDCALIIPIDGDQVWLVEQFRYTVQARALELPQGGWECEVADPEEMARGELREETGLIAGRMTYLGFLWIAYGVVNQKQHVFLAEELTEGPHDREVTEHDIVVRCVTIAEFERMMRAGEVHDASTLAAWNLYRLRDVRSR